MRQPVMDDRGNPRIADQHFVNAARRRIAFIGGVNIAVQQRPQFRQLRSEGLSNLRRPVAAFINFRDIRGVAQFPAHLFLQLPQSGIQGLPNTVINPLLTEIMSAQPVGKQRRTEPFDDMG